MTHQRVFPWTLVMPQLLDPPALWSEAFCYACILIVLSAGIVRGPEGLGTEADSFSGTLCICIIMAA